MPNARSYNAAAIGKKLNIVGEPTVCAIGKNGKQHCYLMDFSVSALGAAQGFCRELSAVKSIDLYHTKVSQKWYDYLDQQGVKKYFLWRIMYQDDRTKFLTKEIQDGQDCVQASTKIVDEYLNEIKNRNFFNFSK